MASVLATAFDLALALLIIWVAVQATSGERFRSVVMFIVFGLLLALAWVRLGAPDVALAEAAVGAGLTGVLLLDTVGRLRTYRRRTKGPDDG